VRVDSSRSRGAIAAGHNFTGVRVEHAATGLTLFGAIDDLWADAGGLHYVVDYKRMYADLALENAAIKDVLSRKL